MTSVPKRSVWQQPLSSCLMGGQLCYEIGVIDWRSGAAYGFFGLDPKCRFTVGLVIAQPRLEIGAWSLGWGV